jgi:glycosyltransferase involved in cell wall biosynthesis
MSTEAVTSCPLPLKKSTRDSTQQMNSSGVSPLFLAKRWEHHSASGGYDQLAKVAGGKTVSRQDEKSFPSRIIRFYWRKTSRPKPYLLDYQFEDWMAECSVILNSRAKTPAVVHVLYGDEQLDLLLRRRWMLPCPLVATFHLPASRARARFEHDQKHLIGGMDAAILVARCQLEEYKKWFGPDRVFYVPHGIDTHRFSPGERKGERSKVRLITVGDHMRDWNVLHRIADECRILNLPVEFDVVVRKIFFPYFTGCPNVRLHASISEEELLALYRNADALLLPLIDATANNALLESMACGTPAISTFVGGIPDYVDDSAGWLFRKGEVDSILDLIKHFCHHREALQLKRAAARIKSEEFDWQEIHKQIASVYVAVTKGGSPNRKQKASRPMNSDK